MTSIIIPNLNGDFYKETEEIFKRILNCGVTVCGFDTESTVQNAFKNSDRDKSTDCYVSIIQICINQNHGGVIFEGISDQISSDCLSKTINEEINYTCYIIPIKQIFIKYKYFPKSMRKFFQSKNIYKVGAGIREDVHRLKKFIFENLKLEFDGFIDLQDIARSIGCNNYSLDSLAQSYLNTNKSKSKLGNYEGELTTDQVYYASHDSYLSLAIYLKMINPSPFIKKVTSPQLDKISITSNDLLYKEVSKINPKANELDISDNDADALLNYLNNSKLLLSNKICKYSSIYNTITCTYKKWNKYDNKSKKEMLDKCLDLLINKNIINKVGDNSYIKVKPNAENNSINSILEELIPKCIPSVGIKEKSLINFLTTSISSLISDPLMRKNTIISFIIESIQNGKLLENNNKLYIK